MLAEARRWRIVEILSNQQNGMASVEELSAFLGVSGMTVRRDFDWLAKRGVLRRVHGGAVVVPGAVDWKPFTERRGEFDREKQLIGWTAAQFIQDGETVILDSGTTTLQVARNLECKRELVAITNALPVAEEVARWRGVTTIVLGGLLKPKELSNVGPMVTQELARLSVDRLILSAAGFSAERGITDPDLADSEVKQAMIRAAREVILVADSSKWGIVAMVQVAPLRAVHKVVTDDGIPATAVRAIEAEGVEVVTPSRMPGGLVEYDPLSRLPLGPILLDQRSQRST